MLSRIRFGINLNDSILKINQIQKNNNVLLLNSNNKIKINQYNQSNNSLLSNKNNISINNHNQFGNNKRFYSTEQPTKQNENKGFSFINLVNGKTYSKYYNKDKGTYSMSNNILLLTGLAFIYLSVPTLIVYFLDKDKPASDLNLLVLLNYCKVFNTKFNLYIPYRILDKEGYIKRIIESYKKGDISKEGKRIIEMMMIYPPLDGIDYLEKYGFYDSLVEKVLSKKGKPAKDDPDSYFVNLTLLHGSKLLPNEAYLKVSPIDQNTNVSTSISTSTETAAAPSLPPNFSNEIIHFASSKFRTLTEITTTDTILASVIAAPIGAFLQFRYRLPMVYLFNSIKRSSLITAAFMSGPILNKAFQQFSINKSEGIGGHVVNTRIATISYGALILYLSSLPFISVVTPIFCTLFLTKSVSFFAYIYQFQNVVNETKLKFKNQNLVKENQTFSETHNNNHNN